MNKPNRPKLTPAVEPLEARQLLTGPPSAVISYSVDGTGNNVTNPTWGSTNVDLTRIGPASYANGISTPAGADRPSARVISNAISDQGTYSAIDANNLSAMAYAWGQFIDHDLDLTVSGAANESFPIAVPAGDPSFDAASTGTRTIPLTRSAYDPATGTTTPRQQVNSITAWLDGSMVYGSNAATAAALRTFTGGLLKTGAGNLLPTNNAATFPGGTLPMGNDAHLVPDNQLFAAGDVRANENIELTSIQTLFVREHNFWAAKYAADDLKATDEQVFQKARSMAIAEIQSITYNEWLPALLGPGAIQPYIGYKAGVNPAITNEFSTAAFRFGHSMLNNDIEFLGNDGLPVAPAVSLSSAFSNPNQVRAVGIDPLLKYLSSDPSSEIDTRIVDSVRNLLFGPPGSGGLDLASLNIQRGRDHGLADYNTTRASLGLPRFTSFAQITSDPAIQAALKATYGSVDKIDLWIGGLVESHVAGGNVGPAFRAIIADQFTRIRDGDRLWFEKQFSGRTLQKLESTTLGDIIRRDTSLTTVQNDPFHYRVGVSGHVFAQPARPGGPPGPGLPGRTVQLIDATSGAVVATQTTDARGAYAFSVSDGLSLGRFQVRLVGVGMGSPATTTPVIALTRGDQMVDRVDIIAPRPGGNPRGNEMASVAPPPDANTPHHAADRASAAVPSGPRRAFRRSAVQSGPSQAAPARNGLMIQSAMTNQVHDAASLAAVPTSPDAATTA